MAKHQHQAAVSYGDNVTFTAVVKDQDSQVIPGEIVTFKDGATTIGTATTNSSGVATLSKSNLMVGSHTITAIADEVTSSSVSVTVNALPAVTSVTLTASASTISEGASVTFTAVVKDQYSSVMSGETVTFKEGSTTIGTGTSDSSGVVTLTKSDFSVGTHTVTAVCSNVTSSSVNVTVTSTPVPTSMTVSSSKDILSYYDSESATLTALVKDQNGSPMSGQTVTMGVYHGSTLVETLSVSDVGDGSYTASYSSKGSGDLSINVECMNLLETYSVEDCLYWNDGSSVGSLEVGSNVSCTSNGEYITITTNTSGEKDVKIPVTLTGDWEFETTLAENMPIGSQLTFKVGTGQQWGAFNPDNTITVKLSSSQNFNKTVQKDMAYKITYINGVMAVYWNNEQLTSKSLTLSSGVKMGYYTNNGRYQYIKNIKLKAL